MHIQQAAAIAGADPEGAGALLAGHIARGLAVIPEDPLDGRPGGLRRHAQEVGGVVDDLFPGVGPHAARAGSGVLRRRRAGPVRPLARGVFRRRRRRAGAAPQQGQTRNDQGTTMHGRKLRRLATQVLRHGCGGFAALR